MPGSTVGTDVRWFVVRTHHRQEDRVEQNLNMGRIETFVPRIQPPRGSRAHGDAGAALFPQYVFARFNPEASHHDVTFTRGVQNILRFGDCLASVSDEVIELFRARMDEHGFVRIGEPLRPGDSIAINSGPFRALAGIVERHLSEKERVIVLLTTLESEMRVEVPMACVSRARTASSTNFEETRS